MAKDSNNKTVFVAIPKRFEITKSRRSDIVTYDLDNKYPQRSKLLTESSVTASACLDLFKKYINGQGFEDEVFGSTVINTSEQTADEILSEISEDYADYGGVCFHFDYNGMLEIINVRVIPFEYTRLTSPSSKNHGKIAIYPDWEESHGRIEDKLVQYVDKFTTNSDLIMAQIAEAGGIENWNGHVMWWSNRRFKYPLPIYDPAINDIETDAAISQFKKSNVNTSFLASHFFLYKGEFEHDGKRQEYIDMLSEFQGAKEAGKFMLIDGVTEENMPEVIPIQTANNDRLYEYHEESTQNNIRKAFLAPKELTGEEYSTGFDTDRISQAREYYNSITDFDRGQVSKIFAKFIPLVAGMETFRNFTIKKLFSNG